MAFWSQNPGEPLRQYRWYMVFNTLSNIQYALKKADKPKAKVNSIQHKYMNHFFNYPGRLEWEDINVTFAAVTDPSASRALFDVLRSAGYGVPLDTISGPNMASIGKQKFNNAIGDTIKLNQVNAEGVVIETWEIARPFFTSVQFGALDYGSEEIVEITCGIKYDWANLTTSIAGGEGKEGVRPPGPTQ